MKNIGFIIIILATLVATGCKGHNQTELAAPSSLELTLPQRADGFIETKAAVSSVQDMWLIQFKGTDVLEAKYFTKDAFKIISNSLFVDMTFIDGVDMIYAVANTANPSLYTGITTKDAILAKQIPFALNTSVTDEQQELPMAGSIDKMTSTTFNRVKLKYMVAKMEITVNTDKIAGGASYTAKTIRVYRIPKVLSLVGEVVPSPASDAANFGDDYEVSSDNVSSSGVFYMAPNCRGLGTSGSQKYKTKAAAPAGQGDWCTYVDIIGQYKASASDAEQTVIYKLWLGNNLTNDYNLNGGSYYKVSVSILNLSNTDSRIAVYDDSFDLSVLPSEGSGDEQVEFITPILPPPANCYVVAAIGGAYPQIRFNALAKPVAKYVKGSSSIANVKGSNPSTVSADAALANDIVYQSGDQLEVVWQTAVGHATGGSMVIKSLNLSSKGVASVQVNGAGNAVLAYKRGSTILWNYHIWATDSNPFAAHATVNSAGNVNGTAEGGTQARFMDRNLGALSVTATKPTAADAPKYFGLLYQYGRTTPFTGQGPTSTLNTFTQIYDKDGSQIAMNNVGGFTVQAEIAVDNVTTVIQNPKNWYYKRKGSYTWHNFGFVTLWSNYGTNKSIYDPCPYGYRVPNKGSWDGFPLQPYATAIDGGMVSFGTWWPAAGHRWYDRDLILNEVGSKAKYWASTLTDVPDLTYSLQFDSGYVSVTLAYQVSAGNSVRCVQEGY